MRTLDDFPEADSWVDDGTYMRALGIQAMAALSRAKRFASNREVAEALDRVCFTITETGLLAPQIALKQHAPEIVFDSEYFDGEERYDALLLSSARRIAPGRELDELYAKLADDDAEHIFHSDFTALDDTALLRLAGMNVWFELVTWSILHEVGHYILGHFDSKSIKEHELDADLWAYETMCKDQIPPLGVADYMRSSIYLEENHGAPLAPITHPSTRERLVELTRFLARSNCEFKSDAHMFSFVVPEEYLGRSVDASVFILTARYSSSDVAFSYMSLGDEIWPCATKFGSNPSGGGPAWNPQDGFITGCRVQDYGMVIVRDGPWSTSMSIAIEFRLPIDEAPGYLAVHDLPAVEATIGRLSGETDAYASYFADMRDALVVAGADEHVAATVVQANEDIEIEVVRDLLEYVGYGIDAVALDERVQKHVNAYGVFVDWAKLEVGEKVWVKFEREFFASRRFFLDPRPLTRRLLRIPGDPSTALGSIGRGKQ